jgi:hypothetical protein
VGELWCRDCEVFLFWAKFVEPASKGASSAFYYEFDAESTRVMSRGNMGELQLSLQIRIANLDC